MVGVPIEMPLVEEDDELDFDLPAIATPSPALTATTPAIMSHFVLPLCECAPAGFLITETDGSAAVCATGVNVRGAEVD